MNYQGLRRELAVLQAVMKREVYDVNRCPSSDLPCLIVVLAAICHDDRGLSSDLLW